MDRPLPQTGGDQVPEINRLTGKPLTPAGVELRKQLKRLEHGPDHQEAFERLVTFRTIALGIAKQGLFTLEQKETLLEAARETLLASLRRLRPSVPTEASGGTGGKKGGDS